ncbi:MAG: hypothetical protein IJQ23_04515, partial [Clostridia bacterium]|nr:hypothetical protein [Clostridia bacterium]
MLASEALVRAFSATEPLPVIESPSNDGRTKFSHQHSHQKEKHPYRVLFLLVGAVRLELMTSC